MYLFFVYAIWLLCVLHKVSAFANGPHLQSRVKHKALNLFGRVAQKVSKESPTDVVRGYFDCWNTRDMDAAVSVFSDDCVYEDTLYPTVFNGKEELKKHLFNVAVAVPDSFQFVVDTISEDKASGTVGVQWHVESDGNQLPFTRGCSMYTVNANGQIVKGFDVPEPTVKSGSVSLGILKIAKNLISDPIRVIPLVAWGVYCWLLFLSDTAPGPNALALDATTWMEVKDLSLNFWLVLPILSPDSAPVVHPVLEGVFNMVLAWSALFAGFLVDGRPKRSYGNDRGNSMLNTIFGMQFLTNAMFMPYLVTREAETDKAAAQRYDVTARPLSTAEAIGESKILPVLLGTVGAVAIYWLAEGRPEYGDLPTRLASFGEIVEKDRLSFSFLIDLAYFAVFQGWLIKDDLIRRGVDGYSDNSTGSRALKWIGSYVPFVGLVYYLFVRPPLLSTDTDGEAATN